MALAGNPNVGKSTIFNSFTGLHQHTGNWTGKTVESAKGEYSFDGDNFTLLDLPGTYSLEPASAEEKAACDHIRSGEYDVLAVVIDAVCIERNLRFASGIICAVEKPVVLCVNLIDEARKKEIEIDHKRLSELLGVPVIPTAARQGKGLTELKEAIRDAAHFEKTEFGKNADPDALARDAFEKCCVVGRATDKIDRAIDRVILSKALGIPIMLALLLLVFWITIVGANYPSQLLGRAFLILGDKLRALLYSLGCSKTIVSAAIDGVYTTLSWVVSVMLPPMAIFFPLFTLMEDCGYLPRIAFNLDRCFCCAGAHGKQSLTTAMGFGCNACAVTGCRIIDSPRERLIAVITNSMIPCNGRFPMILSLIAIFFCNTPGAESSFLRAAIMLGFIVFSVLMSLLASKLLSVTALKGVRSSFVLELPPYRRPQIGRVIVRSIFDRTLFVLLRAVYVAAPAGLVIWLLANINAGGVPLIVYMTEFLDPFAVLLGLDGVILAAFILGFPANEIVLPIALMIYMSGMTLGELPETGMLASVLISHGWTVKTAVCTIIFCLFHFPCSTACLTIYKETKSIRWTALSLALPFAIGTLLCIIINITSKFVLLV